MHMHSHITQTSTRKDRRMVKEEYKNVNIEIISFGAADVIVTSGDEEEGPIGG